MCLPAFNSQANGKAEKLCPNAGQPALSTRDFRKHFVEITSASPYKHQMHN